ncbi:unnamed protein product [Lactuca saligna]|uniref:Uncharacterized protein n=1 Tax=Lactuca saligna TaxID=75948 RepID=A0AA35Z1L6_LACSI|nr:unnamed protein product [Lactuca saligna]
MTHICVILLWFGSTRRGFACFGIIASVMLPLKHILMITTDKNNRMLRAKLTDHISLVGMIAGKYKFKDDPFQISLLFSNLGFGPSRIRLQAASIVQILQEIGLTLSLSPSPIAKRHSPKIKYNHGKDENLRLFLQNKGR